MKKKYDIMAAGHLCVDIIPLFSDTGASRIEEIMRPGKLVNVAQAKISTGGPVSNTGLNMQKLGNSVCFCSCVGDDSLGRMTIDILGKSGSADGVSILNGQTSSYTIVIAPPRIDRIFLHNPGTNNFFTHKDIDSELIAKCRHFHFGYPPLMAKIFENEGDELVKIFKMAKDAGATTSCDMTLPDPASPSGKAPWRKILQKILPFIDIYLPSLEETFYMLYPERFLEMKHRYNNADLIDHVASEDYSLFASELLAMGTKMCSLKSGHRGFYLKTSDRFSGMGAAKPGDFNNWSNRELWAPAFAVEKFGSATGSGDSSIAGLLTAFLKGLTIEHSLKYATCLGYQNVCVLDAVSGTKDWDTTTQMIRNSMPMIEIVPDDCNWNFSEMHQLWVGPGDSILN